MVRPKKDSKAISVRLASDVYERLNDYCERSGQPKTIAIERAITMLIDDYDEKQRIIKEASK